MNDPDYSVFYIIGIFFLILILVYFCSTLIKLSSIGRGEHTGYITAIEQEGFFFPNYKVYVKTDNSSSQEDQYCIHRDKYALANLASQYKNKRQLVTVEFQGVRKIGLGLCDVEIINIKALEK